MFDKNNTAFFFFVFCVLITGGLSATIPDELIDDVFGSGESKSDTIPDDIVRDDDNESNEKDSSITYDSRVSFRADYVYSSETGYFYKAHPFAKSFTAAIKTCKLEGAELATPRTKLEASVLISKFPPKTKSCWIGVHDIYVESEYQTLNGTPATEIYTNWMEGYPMNLDEYDCVTIDEEGFYFDSDCKQINKFICARHALDVTNNVICDTFAEDYFYNINADKCYKLHKKADTWGEALKACRAEMSTLAIVNSQEEAEFFRETLENAKIKAVSYYNQSYVLVDFSDFLESGSYTTSNGRTLEEVGYENWAPGEPNNNGGNEHCGGMLKDGTLADVDCNVKALFFCEKQTQAVPDFTIFQRSGFPKIDEKLVK